MKRELKDRIFVGQHTYGKPCVHEYGEDTELRIGKFCSIAGNVNIFLGGNHRTDWGSTFPFNKLWDCAKYIEGHPATKGDVIIGNDVWIGMNATILSGVTICDGAVIAANSVVTKDVAPYSIVAGNPAVEKKKRFGDKQIQELLNIKWWNLEDRDIEKIVHFLMSENIDQLIKECYKING